jgi:hypothetical protein
MGITVIVAADALPGYQDRRRSRKHVAVVQHVFTLDLLTHCVVWSSLIFLHCHGRQYKQNSTQEQQTVAFRSRRLSTTTGLPVLYASRPPLYTQETRHLHYSISVSSSVSVRYRNEETLYCEGLPCGTGECGHGVAILVRQQSFPLRLWVAMELDATLGATSDAVKLDPAEQKEKLVIFVPYYIQCLARTRLHHRHARFALEVDYLSAFDFDAVTLKSTNTLITVKASHHRLGLAQVVK